jgi:hypothetical protein
VWVGVGRCGSVWVGVGRCGSSKDSISLARTRVREGVRAYARARGSLAYIGSLV